MDITPLEVILTIALLGLGAFVAYFYISTKKIIDNMRSITKDVSGENLEEILNQYIKKLESNTQLIKSVQNKLSRFIDKSQADIQKVAFKRYNPFQDTGGDQSFVLVLLNEKDNGILISSMHQRDVTRVYGKQINNGKSKQKLSKEEQDILNEALA